MLHENELLNKNTLMLSKIALMIRFEIYESRRLKPRVYSWTDAGIVEKA